MIHSIVLSKFCFQCNLVIITQKCVTSKNDPNKILFERKVN